MNLPSLAPWNPLGSYDCSACIGESRRRETDCPECGGTGWAPPLCHHDTECRDCHRPLWFGGRGPQWFEHDLSGEIRCRFCLLRASKKGRTTTPGDILRVHSHADQINLAAFVDKGDETPEVSTPKPERTKS